MVQKSVSVCLESSITFLITNKDYFNCNRNSTGQISQCMVTIVSSNSSNQGFYQMCNLRIGTLRVEMRTLSLYVAVLQTAIWQVYMHSCEGVIKGKLHIM